MDINEKIKEVKERVKLLTGYFPYSDYEINILTVCYLVISSIDNDITDLVDEVFSRVFILFNKGEFNEVLEKFDKGLASEEGSYISPSFNLDRKYKDEFIAINDCHKKEIWQIFDNVLHEMKHAINGIIKGFIKLDSDFAVCSCGLLEATVQEDSENNLVVQENYRYIDEIFNSFLTKVYLDQILVLKNMNVKDAGIRVILDLFSLPEDYKYTYNKETLLWVPLLNDARFFRLFYNAAVFKDYDPLFRELKKLFNYEMDGYHEVTITYIEHLLEEHLDGRNIEAIQGYFGDMFDNYPVHKLELKPHFKYI